MVRRASLLLLVFVAGTASLATEFGASRLLAPYFGDSLYVWGVLIGLVLIYLSVGYVIGGRIADRWPRAQVLYQLAAVAGLWIALIPLVSYPILLASLQGFATLSAGLVLGTLLSVVLLFAVPVVLLGCVSPFAIRLLLRGVESGGNTAGFVYALSTGGSIVGTFLPVFWLIPTFGTRATLIGFGVVLLIASALGLVGAPRRGLIALVLAAAVVVASLFTAHGIKPPERGATLLYERESAYNYVQVVRDGSEVQLILNEGQAIHSIYDPTTLTTRGYWDDMLLASSFRPAQRTEPVPRKVAILGLAGGTVARQYVAGFGRGVQITGVELDPAIVQVGRRYFHLDDAHAHVVVQDARYWLATRPPDDKYDVIMVDAYRQPYIPFHLTTEQFFQLARQHLAPGGVIVVNVGRTAKDYRLVDAIASTMRPVYDNVFLLDPPQYDNTLVYGTTEPTSTSDVLHNIGLARGPLLGQVASDVLSEDTIRPSPYRSKPFTDDVAPVENLIDSMILDVATGREQE